MILTLLPFPAAGPRRYTLAAIASRAPPTLAYASGWPDVIIVISPLAALAAPPEIGASRYRIPFSARRFSSAIDQPGSTVEHITKTLPGFMAAAAPPSPNRTASVCAAFTTTLTTTSQTAATAAGLLQATPPSAAKAS